MKQNETLAEFVHRVRRSNKQSSVDVENASGKGITSSYVNKIENNAAAAEGISVGRLKALAVGLGVALNDIVAVAFNMSTQYSDLRSFITERYGIGKDLPLHFWSSVEAGLIAQVKSTEEDLDKDGDDLPPPTTPTPSKVTPIKRASVKQTIGKSNLAVETVEKLSKKIGHREPKKGSEQEGIDFAALGLSAPIELREEDFEDIPIVKINFTKQ